MIVAMHSSMLILWAILSLFVQSSEFIIDIKRVAAGIKRVTVTCLMPRLSKGEKVAYSSSMPLYNIKDNHLRWF